MLSIGISGGIGSGKSFICEILENMGYPVFYSDIVAKDNMINNLALYSKIVKTFGKESYIEGKINKNYLSKLIFEDKKIKNKLNNLVHPTVFQSYETWKANQRSLVVFNESALLFETDSYKRFDEVFIVTAPLELKIKRIQKRDKCTKEKALSKINAQLSDYELRKFCKNEIINDESHSLLPQIWYLLESKLKISTIVSY